MILDARDGGSCSCNGLHMDGIAFPPWQCVDSTHSIGIRHSQYSRHWLKFFPPCGRLGSSSSYHLPRSSTPPLNSGMFKSSWPEMFSLISPP